MIQGDIYEYTLWSSDIYIGMRKSLLFFFSFSVSFPPIILIFGFH